MSKRYLNELNTEELSKVLNANSKLFEEVQEITAENGFDEIRDIMNGFKKSVTGWSFDGFNRGRVTLSRYYEDDFLEELDTVNSEYCVLGEENERLLKRLLIKSELYFDVCAGYEDMSESRFSHLEKWFNDGIDTVKAALENYCDSIADFAVSADNVEEYFTEIFADYAGDEIYITDDSFKAYKDFTKCYA